MAEPLHTIPYGRDELSGSITGWGPEETEMGEGDVDLGCRHNFWGLMVSDAVVV